MRIFGLIGYPLSHSFSKSYFERKFEKEGLDDCRFENFSISSISDLINQVIPSNPGLEGVAVTIPYKQAVLPLLHSVAGIPEGLRACNCIKIRDGKLFGFNTDYIGFQESFKTAVGCSKFTLVKKFFSLIKKQVGIGENCGLLCCYW